MRRVSFCPVIAIPEHRIKRNRRVIRDCLLGEEEDVASCSSQLLRMLCLPCLLTALFGKDRNF
jgi:hypothetical protein